MERFIDEVVLLLDNYGIESQNLHTSFQLAGKDYPVAVIEEDGFLPEGVISVFGYFLGDFKNAKDVPGKPRYFNQITVPEYWEISGTNASGKIHNLSHERGRIFYAEPKHKRLVKVVDWMDESGVVRSSDHYNLYGALYARTIFNAKGQKVNKSYFSADGKEIIVHNYVTGDIILNEGDVVRIFHTKTDFVVYFMEKTGFDKKRVFFNSLSTPFFVSQRLNGERKEDVLFWQEPIQDAIPGNMQIILNGNSTRTNKIMVQKKDSYEKLIALGASKEVVSQLGYIYPFEKENGCKSEALICTNSDQIENVEKIIAELPEINFHIAAITEMSSKLMALDKYTNVKLYPGVKMNVLDELFKTCDFYFDINHGNEIVSAGRRAFVNNQLIFAFKETVHRKEYVAEEHIYGTAEVDNMLSEIKMILLDKELICSHVNLQHEWAMDENIEAYDNI